jgi:PAS domain S-box-containing protein
MKTHLRVLIIEDSKDDAELLLRELKRHNYEPAHQRVDSADGVNAALDSQEWDVIIADYTMPGFSGTQALVLVRTRGFDTPFIFVSGTLGEDTAVTAMKAGAQDYLVKGNLKRLVPAIERELREAATRQAREEAEAERRAAQARFRQILAVAADAIIVVDEKGRISVFNGAAELLFGYRADETLGKPIDMLIPDRYALAHREHLENFAQSSLSFKRMNDRGEIVGRRKNGEEFIAEASISKLVDGGFITLTVVVRDITARRRAEETLRQLSRAVEQSSNFVIITDVVGQVQYVNRRFLETMGYSIQELLGATPALWKSGKMTEDEYTELWRTIVSGHDWRGEFENKRKDGTLITVSAVISPVRDDSGQITHFVCIQEDITERRSIEAQLQQLHRMEAIGRLTGGFAHDFNNLLTIAIGNLDVLQDELKPSPKAQELANFALTACLRGADLVAQLLAFARRRPLKPAVFDVNLLITETAALLRRSLGERIEVETTLARDVWPVEADPSLVESALANLAINARDAMPEGGRLIVETRNRCLDAHEPAATPDAAPGDYVLLSVTDTGIGIPPENLGRVCEPFFTTKGAKGTGLGLSMVYGFAKQSGGHLRIRSEIGVGTTVELYLPRAAGKKAQRPPATEAGRQTDVQRARILVVEDNPEVRRMVVKQLVDAGHQVEEAEDTAKALAAIDRGSPFDLLFTDIVLPGPMSGRELAREVRRRSPGIKILLTSGYADPALSKDGDTDESTILLSKPYRKRELLLKLAEVLGPGRSPDESGKARTAAQATRSGSPNYH